VDRKFYRVIDANLNRAREALRVAEDIMRFIFDSPSVTRDLKLIRHGISGVIKSMPRYNKDYLMSRSSETDVGRPTSRPERIRRGYADILYANLERAKESLRVLEEFFKLFDLKKSESFKSLRYKLYAIEKKASRRLASIPGAG